MYGIGKIAIATMALAASSMIASDADARGGGGRSSGGFSRMSSFSAPRMRMAAPRSIQRSSFAASKPARSIGQPRMAAVHKPTKIATPHVIKPKPSHQALPKNPPGGVKPPPPLRTVQPKPKPPGNKNPPGHHNPPSSGGGGEGGIAIEIGGGGDGLITAVPQELPTVTVTANCGEYYIKWQETGDKMWKLTYYECTGQL